MERRLVFQAGSSDKFWEVSTEDGVMTVRFGRAGTTGQEQVKDHGSAAAAAAAAEKLVAEKLRKGYVDDGGPPAAAASAPAKARRAVRPRAAQAMAEPLVTPPPQQDQGEAGDAAAPAQAGSHGLGDLGEEDGVALTATEAAIGVRAPLPPRPAPPGAFDSKEALRRLRGAREAHAYGGSWSFSYPPVGAAATDAEARWWIAAGSLGSNPREVATRLVAGGVPPVPADPSVLVRTAASGALPADAVMVCLCALMGADDLLDLMVEPPAPLPPGATPGSHADERIRLALMVRPILLPLCAPTAVSAARNVVRTRLAATPWPTDSYASPDIAFHLAGTFGLEDEAIRVVSGWDDGHYPIREWRDHYHKPLAVLLGIGDPALIVTEAARTEVPIRNVDHLVAWLAATGVAGLDHLAQSLAGADQREVAAELVHATAARLHGPAAAPMFAELVVGSKAPSEAKAWLTAHLAASIVGAGPLALRAGRAGEVTLSILSRARREQPAVVADGIVRLGRIDAAAASRLSAKLAEIDADGDLPLLDGPDGAPTWLGDAMAAEEAAGGRTPTLPPWVDPLGLPPLVVEGVRLGPEITRRLLVSLALSSLDEPRPLAAAARRSEPRSRDALAAALLDGWLSEGAPTKQRWVFHAVGLIGHDGTALRLAPMVRAWPGESQHQRAVTGLGVLAAIGTDTALQQISGISQKVKFRALKERAREAMELIATARGLTKDELEDRIVPDGGLNERGTRRLDYGPRAFLVTLGPGGKPMVREEGPDGRPIGKARADLPGVTGKDDAAVANATRAEWKLLKKQVAEVAKVQTARLERAMVSGRRWSPADLDQLLVRHPLLGQLVRPLVWGAWDPTGRMRATFRVTDEGDVADVDERPVTLESSWQVGIVHLLHLDEAAARRWGEVLADYELLAPFPQLSRATFALGPGEDGVINLTRFATPKVPGISLMGTLVRLGWNRGPVQDGGWFAEHSKPFFAAQVTAVAEHEGLAVGYPSEAPDQGVDHCFFVPGIYLGGGSYVYPEHKARIPWGQVDPVVVSEVLADLEAVSAKAG